MKAGAAVTAAQPPYLLLKIDSLRTRARMLTGLRRAIDLKPHQDIRAEQWEVLENQLAAVSNKIQLQLRLLGDRFVSEQYQLSQRRVLAERLGELEIELTGAYNFYDTFMDILTQRLSDGIGPLLRGCDVIAADGLRRGFLADITTMPLVFCERGYGAYTLRESVNVVPQIPNPIPFIAIPYARIMEKYNLISIYHEVGHQAMVKMNMVKLGQQLYADTAAKRNAVPLLRSLFANWSKELLPDFWAFAHTGMAQTSSIRDVLLLPGSMMFQLSVSRPHPPPYLRFLASVEWCRTLWGKGDWDEWEAEWLEQFPTKNLDRLTRETILAARKLLPVMARATLDTRFRKLGGKALSGVFDFNAIHPGQLKKYATPASVRSPEFGRLPLGVQLAAFRLLREKRAMKASDLDALMSRWIVQLPLQQSPVTLKTT